MAATALPEPLTARAAETTAPARVPSWTGAASGAARALVEAAVEVEVMATAPVRARGSNAAASGAAPAPARGFRFGARPRDDRRRAGPNALQPLSMCWPMTDKATVASQIGSAPSRAGLRPTPRCATRRAVWRPWIVLCDAGGV